ncbi:hypothetical protein B0H14DRAFT_3745039 [Mycena olivaceomarginata]|nr:hypothetical protein B0H14DRAFT_3745039 [Mycena olivaceomarginata]
MTTAVEIEPKPSRLPNFKLFKLSAFTSSWLQSAPRLVPAKKFLRAQLYFVFYCLNAAAFHGYWYTTFRARPKLLQSRSRPTRERAKKVAADNMAAAAQALPLNAVIVERRDVPVLLDRSTDHFLLAQRREPVSPRWLPDPSARPFTQHRPTRNYPIAPSMLAAISQPLFHPSAASSPAVAPKSALDALGALTVTLIAPARILAAPPAAPPAAAISASATSAPLPTVSTPRLAPLPPIPGADRDGPPRPCRAAPSSKTREKRRPAPYSKGLCTAPYSSAVRPLAPPRVRASARAAPRPASKDAPLRAQSGVSKCNGRTPVEPTDKRPKKRARTQAHSAVVLDDIWNLVDDGERARAEKAARRTRREEERMFAEIRMLASGYRAC